MINEEDFKKLVAKNLTNYRKINNLTQLDVANRLNYSDKAISKWERGESIPDAYTLSIIAESYGITLNDLTTEHQTKKKEKRKSTHVFVTILSTLLVWFIAVTTFVILGIIFKKYNIEFPLWKIFLYAIPVMGIVLTVFTHIWYNRVWQCIAVSILVWGIAVSLACSLQGIQGTSLLYVIAGAFQVLAIVWYIMRFYLVKHKN